MLQMVEAEIVSQSLISGTVQAFFVYRVWRSKFLKILRIDSR